MNTGILLGRLTPYQAQEFKLVDEQNTGDIINAITTAHKKYRPEYKKIAGYFRGSNAKQTGQNIFNFLKNNVRYVIEPNDKQTVKSPAAIIAEKEGDCKHYSSWAGGILDQLNIPFSYRFASYKMFDKTPQHVFVVINPGTKNEIWLDPVLSSYDYKKPYTYAKDKQMALYSVSGIGAPPKKQAKAEKKAAKKAAGKTVGQKLKKGTKAVLKVAASPVRNAFLVLVKINFANLAVKLQNAYTKAPSKVQIFWESAGGKIQALKTAWEKGSSKKRIFGIGLNPAALAAAAAPLLIKVTELLKSIGVDPEDLVQIGKDALNKKAQELAKKVLEPKAGKDASELEVSDQLFDEGDENIETETLTKKKPGGFKNMTTTLPLLLGGAAVVYFLTRKK